MRLIKLSVALLSLSLFIACGDDEEEARINVEVPDQFSVDIPSSISSNTGSLNGRTTGDDDGIIEGNEIYESLRYFIHLGEESAEVVELTLQIGAVLGANNITSFTFEGDDDGRTKRIDLTDEVTRGGVSYEFEMTMVDTENEDMALQVLWNTNPVSGVAILKPYNLDRTDQEVVESAILRIDYTEDHATYEAAMTVSISGVEAIDNGDIDNMKMFVGRNGDIVDVMGNSNHPNISIIDPDFEGGRNYAFVARGDESTDLGVANLWLPPSDVTTNDFTAGDEYSVYAVLEAEIEAVADGFLTEQEIADILAEAYSPAYFNDQGFITSGEDNKPMSFSDTFVDLSGMVPFVPNDVKNLTIDFIQ
ncbi:MAG: hypothetical protein RLN88_09545 [Ekhidna sp.]|uniref:hypothetical protein n=1 Tax=Ekhidna sp. TaxID=2608089 RepID=UPI0032EBE265